MPRIPESKVVEIWKTRLLGKRRLTAESGETVEVVYPGRRNDDRGADFRDATVVIGRQTLQGCIEIHSRAGDWQAHGHHLDPVYNRVVLQVALSGTGRNTILENGKSIPTVLLGQPANRASKLMPARPGLPGCRAAHLFPGQALLEHLDSAGDARFQSRVNRFYTGIREGSGGQCLYEGIMGSLGYTRNKLPFQELARRVPIRLIESTLSDIKSKEGYISRLQAMLVGTAGLLPSQRSCLDCPDDAWVCRLEKLWARSQHPQAMSIAEWHLFKVRPGNFPVRRIAAMTHLLYRYRGKCLPDSLISQVQSTSDGGSPCLEKALIVTDQGYWAHLFDFGSGYAALSPALIGGARAAEIVVNVLLPFAAAWGKINALPGICNNALILYRDYHKLESNTIERHMKEQLGLDGRLVDSARRQQGLMHIYNTLCSQGRCGQCDLASLAFGKQC